MFYMWHFLVLDVWGLRSLSTRVGVSLVNYPEAEKSHTVSLCLSRMAVRYVYDTFHNTCAKSNIYHTLEWNSAPKPSASCCCTTRTASCS